MSSSYQAVKHSTNNLSKEETLFLRKTKFIDKWEAFVRKLPISEKNLGAWIRAFHFNLPIYMLFLVCFGPKEIALLGLLGVFGCLSIFIYLQSCWLSLLEKRICADDVNIVDAWIEVVSLKRIDYSPSNKKNLFKQRFKATMIIGISYIFVILFIYYNRFHVNMLPVNLTI